MIQAIVVHRVLCENKAHGRGMVPIREYSPPGIGVKESKPRKARGAQYMSIPTIAFYAWQKAAAIIAAKESRQVAS